MRQRELCERQGRKRFNVLRTGPILFNVSPLSARKQWPRWQMNRARNSKTRDDSMPENFVRSHCSAARFKSLAPDKEKKWKKKYASASTEQWSDLTIFPRARANLCSAQDGIMFHASVTNGRETVRRWNFRTFRNLPLPWLVRNFTSMRVLLTCNCGNIFERDG